MTIFKNKKVRKYRGSHTHGGGSKKKRRGAGSRGGRGNAGSGKRADQKKPSFIKKFGTAYYGKKGFTSKKKSYSAINLSSLNRKLSSLLKSEKITKEKDVYIIDLSSLGYNKLLGSGEMKDKCKITTNLVSKKALEKIEKIGGEIIQKNGASR